MNSLFEMSHDMLCVSNSHGVFTQVNAAWSRTLGWTPKELMARPFVDFVHPEDRERTLREMELLTSGVDTPNFRNRYRGSDGAYRWIDWRASFDPDSQLVYAVARDISDLMALHQSLRERDEQLTRLMAEQLDVRDRELRRIADALHDSAVQNSAAALMFLDVALNEDLSNVARDHVERARAQVRSSLCATRNVVRRIDPLEILSHDVGAAIEGLAEDISEQFQMHVSVDVTLTRQPSEEVASMIYRVVREGLVNAGKHAYGSLVQVSAHESRLGIHVEVADNGSGGPPARDSELGLGLGLPVLRERVRRLGGILQLSSNAEGTRLTAFLPTPIAHVA